MSQKSNNIEHLAQASCAVTIVLQFFDVLMTTASIGCGTVWYTNCLEQKINGVISMNNEVTAVETTLTATSNKEHTLKTLFSVICADNEFSLLRRTLELYCEEIERQIN
jgi:hypothetical protein